MDVSVPGISIRELVPDHAAAYWRLRLESLEGEPFAFGSSPEEHRATTPEDARRRIERASDDGFFLGAFAGEALAGLVRFMRAGARKERHKGWIYGMYVTPARRRAGLGRALLGELIGRCRRDVTLEQLHLGVTAGQAAPQRLYASLGFVRYGTEPRALKIGDAYLDEDLMVLRLR